MATGPPAPPDDPGSSHAVPWTTPPDSCCVVLGDTVTLCYPDGESGRYVIVDPLEAPVEDRRISSDSPLGRAVLGRHVGEVVEVEAPGGRYRCRIESAERR